MATESVYMLVNCSNTTNRLLKDYHQLYSQIMSMKIDNTLSETFEEIQRISGEIRTIQEHFHEKFSVRENELSSKWKIYGVKLGEHLGATVEHTYISDELIEIFSNGSLWERIWKARKVLDVFSRLNKSAQKSSQKGQELNQLINSGEFIVK